MDFGKLVITLPDGKVMDYQIEKGEVLIGRNKENDLCIPHITVSRRHASLKIEAGILLLEDLQSANGTFVDGVQLKEKSPQPLLATQKILLGDVQIRFIPPLPASVQIDDIYTVPMDKTPQKRRQVRTDGPLTSMAKPVSSDKKEVALEFSKILIPLVGTLLAACISGVFLILSNNNYFAPKSTPSPIDTPSESNTIVIQTSAKEPSPVLSPSVSPSPKIEFTPTATILPTVEWVSKLTDDFSNKKSGWGAGKTDQYEMGYVDGGGYQITVNNFMAWTIFAKSFDDIQVDVNVIFNPGEEMVTAGVMCRYQDSKNFYVFFLDRDGTHAIVRYKNGEYIPLDRGNVEGDVVFHKGEASNRLGAMCSGNNLKMFLNGKKVLEATDDSYKAGNICLLGSSSAQNQKVVFQDLRLLEPK